MIDWHSMDTAPKDGTRIMLWVMGSHRRNGKPDRATFGYWWTPPNGRKDGIWVLDSGGSRDPLDWAPEPSPPLSNGMRETGG